MSCQLPVDGIDNEVKKIAFISTIALALGMYDPIRCAGSEQISAGSW
jgi:hypothetical protein